MQTTGFITEAVLNDGFSIGQPECLDFLQLVAVLLIPHILEQHTNHKENNSTMQHVLDLILYDATGSTEPPPLTIELDFGWRTRAGSEQ